MLASEAAWNSGDEWLDALIRQLDHARAEFGRLLGQRLPQARYVPPEASYLAWVDCAELDLGPEPAEVFLRRGRVALGRGLDFGAPGDGFVRVTIGTSSALLAEIADRMAAAVAAAMQAVLNRLPAACQYGAGLLGVLASEAAWNSGRSGWTR